MATPAGPLEVRSSIEQYAPHQIPGWERPVAGRVVSALAGAAARQLIGARTDEVSLGHGTLVVRGAAAGDLELHCSVFWIAPLDSIAVVYDSLAAEDSPAVSASPPISLQRLEAGSSVVADYVVQRDRGALRFEAADRRPLASLHASLKTTLEDQSADQR